MFTRVHKKKDQVGQCMSLRGAKRRGNLPVQSLVIEALKVSVGPTPEKSSKTEHFTRRLPRPDGLAMTTRGKLARIRRNAYLESVPTDCPPSVILPCFAWQNDSSPMLTHRGAFFLSAKLCNRLCQCHCSRFGLLQGVPGGADLHQQGPGAEVLVVAVF